MRIHFIAIGGAAMHNLALALHHMGHNITGSDDEINEPSRTRLALHHLLPSINGWFPEKITSEIDAIVLGMHARVDNPELLRAQNLGIRIYSYPEFVYDYTRQKTRVVIGGSHGKTTITSMIMHVLKNLNMDFDYLVGSQIAGFETMVRLSTTAPFIIVEGDEYLASPIDRRPKFHVYKAQIGVISGIAWDHINVFPTYEDYKRQFEIFAQQLPPEGHLYYSDEDDALKTLIEGIRIACPVTKYEAVTTINSNGTTYIVHDNKQYPLRVFGHHNMLNIQAACSVCNSLGVPPSVFYEHMQSFGGAARRLECVGASATFTMYKDFAHSPSKVLATVQAVRNQFANRKMVACLELHTFSSLNHEYLKQYRNTMNGADVCYVYFNPHTIAQKKLDEIAPEYVWDCFAQPGLKIFTDSAMLKADLLSQSFDNSVLLIMSSGTFDGWNFDVLYQDIAGRL